MQYQIMKLEENKEEQLKALFEFILNQAEITEIAHPRTLIEGWHSGAIKIFIAKESEEIKSVKIVLIIKDPFCALKYHLIESLSVGNNDENFNRYVNNALDIYR